MVEFVETMMTADSLRLTAYGQDGNEMRIAKDLPEAKTPHEQESSQREFAAARKQIDAVVCELYRLAETCVVGGQEIRFTGRRGSVPEEPSKE